MRCRNVPLTSAGNKYILVVVDHFTRYCVAVPLADQTAPSIAKAFIDHWVMRFGVPLRTHTD